MLQSDSMVKGCPEEEKYLAKGEGCVRLGGPFEDALSVWVMNGYKNCFVVLMFCFKSCEECGLICWVCVCS